MTKEMSLASRKSSLVGNEKEVKDVGKEENKDSRGSPPNEWIAEKVDNLTRLAHVLGPIKHASNIEWPRVPKKDVMPSNSDSARYKINIKIHTRQIPRCALL